MALLSPDVAEGIESAVLKIHEFLPLVVKLAALVDPVDAAIIQGVIGGLDKMLVVVSVMVSNDSEAKAVDALKAARNKVVSDWKERLARHKPAAP